MDKSFIEISIGEVLQQHIEELAHINDDTIEDMNIEITTKSGDKYSFSSEFFQVKISEYEDFY